MDFLTNFPDNLLTNKAYSTLILGGTISILVFLNFIKNWVNQVSFFKKLNIPGPTPWPLSGNFLKVMKEGFAKHDIEIMKKYGRIVGYFEGSTPVVLTTDTKFIKNVMIKDFNHFVNRRTFDSFSVEPTDKFMTILKDGEWKNVRAIVTSAFTSGKLKSMSKHINECSDVFEKNLEKLSDQDGIFDTKKLFSGFTLDVISSCCFGVSTNSINEPDNEFIVHMQKIFRNSVRPDPKIMLLFFFPKLAGFLCKKGLIEFFPMKSLKFFENFINMIIERRKNKLETRDDFIQNILDHEENKSLETIIKDFEDQHSDSKLYKWNTELKKTLTNKEILSQSILFLLAGYETTAQTLCYVAYNLAMNPVHQQKLCEEIDTVLDRHNGKISYDSVNEMKLMDNVIDETLRLFPPAMRLDREANEDYEYNGMKIKKGMVWSVPIWALHHDPEIYPDPYEFKPERFEEQEKKKRDNVAFLAFGAGPRNCIAMRFALIEIKLLLALILSKFSFEKCDKTPETIEIDNSGFARPKVPIIVKINRR
uniref:Cytochrome p450 3044A1 n=1 Tax=Brachionus koreanus TaxID=1199090 RepID=W8RKV5_9BILA|nr:cytochrome p450 3044A1 [Brachionus koreanus]